MPGVWNFAFRRFSNTKQAAPNKAWTLRCSLGGTQTLNKSINNSQIPFERLLRHPSHSSRQHGTLKDAVRHQKAPTDTRKAIQCEQEPPRILEQPFGVPGTVCWCRLVSVGFCWCLFLSWIVLRYLEEVIVNIWVKCMYVYGVWMCVRVFWSAQALHGETNALYRKCIKRQNSMHLTLLKHQNTKTSLYKLSKNN